MLKVVFALFAAVHAGRSAEAVTPVEKVVSLLEDMQTQVRTEGTAEAATYETFACFCRSQTNDKQASIESRTIHKATLTADLQSLTGTRDELSADIAQLNKDLDAQTAALKKATEIRDREHADYMVAHTDIAGAADGLNDAMARIQGSALTAIKSKVTKGSTLVDALDLGKNSETVAALIQSASVPGAPDTEYDFHSNDILDILEGLQTTYNAKKSTIENEETAAQNSFNGAAESKRGEIQTTEDTIATKTDQRATAESDMATTQADLTETTALLNDDHTYMKDLTEQCERKSREWDQRSTLRKGELEAIGQALEILSGTVSEKSASAGDGGRFDVSLVQKPKKIVGIQVADDDEYSDVVFAQVRAVHAVSASALRLRVITMLKKDGKSLQSPHIQLLAMKMAADPFAKVKTLIQKLIERLISEGTDEGSHKGWCDTELRTAETDRDFRHSDCQTLIADTEALEARKVSLEQERDQLASDISDLNDAHTDASNIRADNKEENKRVLSEANLGLDALNKAIGILKNFYHEAGKGSMSFVEKKQSPVDTDLANAGGSHLGAYQGNQAKAGGILGMLDTIKSDFERTISETTEAEHQSDRDYVKFDRETKASIESKTVGKQHTENDLKMTIGDLEASLRDLQSNQGLLDQANQALSVLRPACVDTGMGYEERVRRRQAEIDALKNAACTLDEEDGELSDCPASFLQKRK